MKIQQLELQDFLTKHEHSLQHLLSSSDCDGQTLEQLLDMADGECRELWSNLTLGYTQSQGLPLLRREVASQYSNINTESVLITSSTNEALMIAFQALLGLDDHIICSAGFEPHYRLPEALGSSIDFWNPKYLNGEWVFAVDELEGMINSTTKAIILSLPHNPTGSTVSQEQLERICDLADSNNITIIDDEVFRGVERDPENTLKSVSEMYENSITCTGLSKVYGVAGARMGWLIVQDQVLRDQILTWHYYNQGCTSAPSEILALITLRNSQKILADNCKVIGNNIKALAQFFENKREIFAWSQPLAGTIGLAELVEGNASKFCDDVASEANIMLIPSTVFGYGNNHFRVGYGRKKLPVALEALEDYLDR